MISLHSRKLGQPIVAGWIPALKGVFRSESGLSGGMGCYEHLSKTQLICYLPGRDL